MFTGIVQGQALILNKYEDSNSFSIKTNLDLSSCKIGSSINCDGICLTITSINYENSDYSEAINSFQAAIEYQSSLIVEEEIPEDPDEIDDGYDLNTDIIAKSTYWMGESYIKLGQFDQAIESFRKIIEDCRMHYLSTAAERRIDQLK